MISNKQKKILAFPYSKFDAIICDGAVRSGKTSIMTVSFIDWAMREFSGQRFGLCGKTVDSCAKNLVVPYISLSYAKKSTPCAGGGQIRYWKSRAVQSKTILRCSAAKTKAVMH